MNDEELCTICAAPACDGGGLCDRCLDDLMNEDEEDEG